MTFTFDVLTRRLLLISHDEEVVSSLEAMIQERIDTAWADALQLVRDEHAAEEKRLTEKEQGRDPYRVPLLGNWLGGLKAAAQVLEARKLSDTRAAP